jgi:hypothetical protein
MSRRSLAGFDSPKENWNRQFIREDVQVSHEGEAACDDTLMNESDGVRHPAKRSSSFSLSAWGLLA